MRNEDITGTQRAQNEYSKIAAGVDAIDPVEIKLQELAALSTVEYQQTRKDSAKELGFQVSVLDNEVKQRRKIADPEPLDIVEQLEPWEQPVDGLVLYNKIESTIGRYVVMDDGMTVPLALWVMGTYALDYFSIFPKLLIKSPERQCGKSTLIETLEGLVYKGYVTNNITASSLFRVIDKYHPTILIDEADLFLKDDPELNGIINCGHKRRTATVTRNVKVNDDYEPRKFDVWSAQAISGIGSQRDTLTSRSIEVYLRRRLPDETVDKLPVDFYEQNTNLRRMCLRWTNDNADRLRSEFVEAPPCGDDRKQDNYSPLWTIAKLIGGHIPVKLEAIYNLPSDDDNESAGLMLLADIKRLLKHYNSDNVFSRYLVDNLIKLEDRPWSEWRRGKPISQNSLSRLLSPYKIRAVPVRVGGEVARGFHVEAFQDAFDRYLPPSTPIKVLHRYKINKNSNLGQIQSVTRIKDVTLQNPRNLLNLKDCNTVTLQKGGMGSEGAGREIEEI